MTPATRVIIETACSPLSFIRAACTPQALIDGARCGRRWGQGFAPLPTRPVPHSHLRRLPDAPPMRRGGRHVPTFIVAAGHTPMVSWGAAGFALLPSRMQVRPDGPRSAGAAPGPAAGCGTPAERGASFWRRRGSRLGA